MIQDDDIDVLGRNTQAIRLAPEFMQCIGVRVVSKDVLPEAGLYIYVKFSLINWTDPEVVRTMCISDMSYIGTEVFYDVDKYRIIGTIYSFSQIESSYIVKVTKVNKHLKKL